MKLLDVAVSRKRSSLSILLLIILLGLYARDNMTLETQPYIAVPFVLVQVYLDGVSPEDGDRLLVRPLENEIRSIEGVEEIIANSYESLTILVVEFDTNISIDDAIDDVRAAVDRAQAELPRDAEEPTIEEISADQFPAMVITLSGDALSERELFRAAQLLQRQVENIPDVLKAEMLGHREEVAEAVIDPARLQHYGITSDDLTRAIVNNNLLVPAGELDTGTGRFSIRVPGLIENYQDVLNLPLKYTTEGVVGLADIATVRRTFKDANRYTTVNGQRAITIEVEKRARAGAIELSNAVREVVDANRELLPDALEVRYVLDKSGFTNEMVGEMEGNIVTAMALVMIVVIGALGLRSGILVGLGIPFSLLTSIIILKAVGFSFNFMVMFGMLLALGMLIDGAIVITEYADRKMAEGLTSRQAYLASTERMFWPVVASTATTLAAFLPIMFWPGVVGQFMRYLPVTVFSVLACSLMYALLFAPLLGSLFKRGSIDEGTRQYLNHLELESPVTLRGFTGRYARLLNLLVQRPITVILLTIVSLVVIFILFVRFNVGVEFFTEGEEKYGQVAVRAQGNLSVEEIRQLSEIVEQRVIQVPGIHTVYASAGYGDGAPAGPRADDPDLVSSMLVELDDPASLGRPTRQVFEDIRQRCADIAGIIVNAGPFDTGPPVGKPVQIQLESLYGDRLFREAYRLRDALKTEFAGLRDISDTLPLPGVQWEIEVDRALAAQMGANIAEVGRAIQFVTNGVKIGEYRPDDADEEVDIRVRYPLDNRGLAVLDDLRVNTAQGAVPISTFVKRIPSQKVDKVRRVNGVLAITLKADVAPGVLADDKVQEIRQWLQQHPADPAVSISFRGANEEQSDSIAFLSVAFSLALFLMLIMLVTQFNSFYQGLLILSAVIMSTAGVLLGLLVSQSTFSTVLTGVGIVALAGIVVNNNIVLIDTYNYVRRQQPQLSAADAVVRACAQRLRPVFLTTVTTILGLLPLASNTSIDLINRSVVTGGVIASTWVPLASAIVYGLAFSTLLTLIVTPVMLLLPQRVSELIPSRR